MSNESLLIAASYSNSGATPVQGSWKYGSHENVSVSDVSAASSALDAGLILLSLTDYAYVALNGTATSNSMILPPGMIALIVNKGDTLNFLQVSTALKASIIVPV